ncbi:MAG: ATP-binding cassette domain-containing protein [Sulfurospirillum sp.]
MLRVDRVVYNYKDEDRYDFSLDAKKGEVVGIIGASGNGKSTLLDLVAGFLSPVGGKITLDEKDLTHLPPEKRPVTILFQNYNLFEHLSVERNVLLGISGSCKNNILKKVYEILKEVGLEGFEKKIASTLSGGQQQRVALARSLLRNKPVLLLDEPFTGLDFNTREHMLKLVKNITKTKQICTIMVTHELDDCKKIADKTYEVKNGKLTLL